MTSHASPGTTDPAAREVRVLVVDDHEVLTAGVSALLDTEPGITTVGVRGALQAGIAAARELRPDVLLLDHQLPDGDGVASIPHFTDAAPGVRVVVLTGSSEPDLVAEAMERGAVGFLPKSRSMGDVVAAVRAAAAGETALSSDLLGRLVTGLHRRAAPPAAAYDLTAREREILALLAEGLTNRAIAERLVVSVHTVRNHVARLLAKLGARSKLEALVIATRDGLVPPA